MGSTVTIYNNRMTIIHMPKAGKGEIPADQFAAMSPSAQMAAMIKPKYSHKGVALKPGPNDVSREHLEMLEGQHGGRRNDAWLRMIRRQWVSLDPQPYTRAIPQRGVANFKRYDSELAEVPGYRLPEGAFQPWPERPIGSLFATGSQTHDVDRIRATAQAMGIEIRRKDDYVPVSELIRAMSDKVDAQAKADTKTDAQAKADAKADAQAKADTKASSKPTRIGGK